MILIPATSHQITWSVQNLTDSTTYYVQAKIRDTRTETLLATVNLTNLGNGRFSGTWLVPQDPTGFGRNIEIEKTIYTDSGYTTPSETYGRWLDQYLIFNLGARNSSTGGYGGSSGIDYKKISALVKAEVDKLKESEDEENKEKPQKVDLSEVLSGLQAVISGLSGLSARISAVEDAGGVSEEKIDGTSESVSELKESVAQAVNVSTESIIRAFQQSLTSLSSEMQRMSKDEKMDILLVKQDIDDKISAIIEKFGEAMDGQGKKISRHIQDTLGKPINVSLLAKTVPEEKPDPRKEKIRNLIPKQ